MIRCAAPRSLAYRSSSRINAQRLRLGQSLPGLRGPAQVCRGQRIRSRVAFSSATALPISDIVETGSFVNTLFVSSVGVAIAINIGISALPLLSGAAENKSAARTGNTDEDESEEVKWGVMSVISFLPLLNWLVRVSSPAGCLVRLHISADNIASTFVIFNIV